MATYYKGAGIGTHWHTNDPRKIGFTPRSPESSPDTETIIEHVSTSTLNSPFVSLSRSYAVAWHYAINSGADEPTHDNPGYVYVIEIMNPLHSNLKLIDPVREVGFSLHDPNYIISDESHYAYQHNGLPNFPFSVVDPINQSEFQIGRQPQPPGPGAPCPPNLTVQLEALVNALRDAEILVHGHIPSDFVKDRHNVVFM